MEDKPNYYSVIPAIVRYDNELKPNEKLLYGEISALTNRNGECWASNDYFAKLYDKSKDTVSDWISKLNKKGYISVELIRNETTKAIEKRIIRINPLLANIDLVPVKSPIGYRQKSLEGIGKKTEENNTSINNTSINIKEIYKEKFELFWEEYPKKVNKFKTEEWFNKNKLTDEQFNLIIAKLKKFKGTSDWKKDNGKYIPYPTTWLNQKRWEDDVPEDASSPENVAKYSEEWWNRLGSGSSD